MSVAIERFEFYDCGRRGVLRRGDTFCVAAGPYYTTDDNTRVAYGERGRMKFIAHCRQGEREWIEAWADGFAFLNLGRPYVSSTVPGLVRRPYRIVRLVSRDNRFEGDPDMTTKTKRAKASSKKATATIRVAKGTDKVRKEPKPERPAKAAQPRKEPAGDKRLSAIDAAAQVLQAAGAPMNTKQMIDAMAAQGLWSSPAGKTPAATLYSAILREISTKGDAARFTKTDRGMFVSK